MILHPPRTRRVDTLAMATYWAGTIIVGIITILGDPAPTLAAQLGPGPGLALFGAGYTLVGAAGLAARLTNRARTEAAALMILGAYTALHGLLILLDGALASGLRIALAPCALASLAIARRGYTITRP